MNMLVIRDADGIDHRRDPHSVSGYNSWRFPEIINELDKLYGRKIMSARMDGQDPFWTRPENMDAKIEAMLRYQFEKERLDRVVAALPELQARCALWRTDKDKASWVPPTSINVAYKAWEESGEFGRAVLAIEEHREGRGDPFQEAAQTVLVLLTWFGIHHPDRDLLTEVLNEMERCGA
jgi:hypothetical protein